MYAIIVNNDFKIFFKKKELQPLTTFLLQSCKGLLKFFGLGFVSELFFFKKKISKLVKFQTQQHLAWVNEVI